MLQLRGRDCTRAAQKHQDVASPFPPTWVISPFAKPAHLESTLYEHTSILKFIETIFGLPTLASVNHQFDDSTPGGANNEASNGNGIGPPAPPRDGRSDIGNLLECFTF